LSSVPQHKLVGAKTLLICSEMGFKGRCIPRARIRREVAPHGAAIAVGRDPRCRLKRTESTTGE
jgi:hypothetical protein